MTPTRLFRNFSNSLLGVSVSYTLILNSCVLPVVARSGADRTAKRTHTVLLPKPFVTQSAHRDGELLIRFRPGVSEAYKTMIVMSRGLRREMRLRGGSRIEKLIVPTTLDLQSIASTLRTDPAIEFVEPNYLIRANSQGAGATLSASLPALNPEGNSKITDYLRRVAPRSRPELLSSAGGAGSLSSLKGISFQEPSPPIAAVVIAVVDGGIDFTHPDLVNSQWTNPREIANGYDEDRNALVDDVQGWDFVADGPAIIDQQGHGTAVAGIIKAGVISQSLVGASPGVSLMSLRVLDVSGTGDVARAVEAIDYAVAQKAQIINCSWETDQPSAALHDAIQRAGRRGALVIAAAGNETKDLDREPRFPAAYDLGNLVSVAATGIEERLAPWSNWGATRVTLAAPGVEILSTKLGGNYQRVSGSSMAAAVVSGVAGLIKNQRPWLSPERTRQVIVDGGRSVISLRGKVASGGVVHPPGALAQLVMLPAREGLDPHPGVNGGNNPAPNPTVPDSGTAGQSGPGDDRPDANDFKVSLPDASNTAPYTGLPNLDEVKRKVHAEPRVSDPIPSTMRHPRTPLAPRLNLRVGDPLPVQRSQNRIPGQDLSSRLLAWSSDKLLPRPGHDQSRNLPAEVLLSSNLVAALLESGSAESSLLLANAPLPQGSLNVDQWVRDFHQYALVRQPNAAEQEYWNDILRLAYTKGQDSLLQATREEGRTVFESSEYQNRNRTDEQYVTDLYWACLRRAPDPGGLAYWTSQVPSQGRENIRRAFDESGEFVTIVNSLVPNGTAGPNVTNVWAERLELTNATGSAGVDLLSRNFGWSLPIISLAGRAGLDLGLALSLNTTIWTKSGPSGPYIYFDEANGAPSPGLRLGFPVVQERYFNARLGLDAYIIVTSSGASVELRQVGQSNIYEAADSSYLQLTDNGGGNLLLKATDGTQLSYSKINNEYRCIQVKDRNGNFLTVTYEWWGQIKKITDTLNREITFNYDSNKNLLSITQLVNGQEHQWATFGWGTKTINAPFSNLAIVGAKNGASIPVLVQVGLPNSTRYNFDYNDWGQVQKIRYTTTSDSVERAYTLLTTDTGTITDCPRITQTSAWAKDWNNDVAVSTSYVPATTANWVQPHNSSGQSGLMAQMNAPDGTSTKLYVHATGWDRGLPLLTETWHAGARQRWATTDWTQDNTGITYQLNPRITEKNVGDGTNRRRTSIDYHASFGLPLVFVDFAADTTTPIRFRVHHYKWDAAYLDRRIIGLPESDWVFNGSWQVQVKVSYQYDFGGEHMQGLPQTPVQHDGQSYPASFTYGRGNLCSITRWDADDESNFSKAVESKNGFNFTGSLTFSRDPRWNASSPLLHQSSFSYTDSFSDQANLNTFAYPTTVTNGDNFSTTLQYHYKFGVVTRTQDPKGAVVTHTYDGAGRLQETRSLVNDAYKKFVYGPNYVTSYATVNTSADEAYSTTVFDGAGRTIATASNLLGSSGGYSGQLIIYDTSGRLWHQSNPADTNTSGATWQTAGLDAGPWRYTVQTYDWNNRPLLTTNTDNTTREVTYGGCGCAGGEVATIRDEVGRRQRITRDVVGRVVKEEVLNWNQTVYSTTTKSYNARDQLLTSVTQGTTGPSQTTTLTYDGHGRLKTKQEPRETAACNYSYYPDDTLQTKTDARGATATYQYNGRHQVLSVNYGTPGSVWATPTIAFDYDSNGNRLWMTDGAGRTDYVYNTLSQLTSETRQFTGFNTYTLNYTYNLAGALKTSTDGLGGTVTYNHDLSGKLGSMTSTGYNGGATLASGIEYRAWGAVKQSTYGDSRTLTTSYNHRLQLTALHIGPVMNAEFTYTAEGRVNYVKDIDSGIFDRLYTFDHAGRIGEGKSGAEARGLTTPDGPYKQTYGYDVWGNMTSRTGRHWTQPTPDFTATFINDRNPNWQYDASGNVTQDEDPYFPKQLKYDAEGRTARMVDPTPNYYGTTFTDYFDGDGQQVKRVRDGLDTYYYLRSTVLGGQKVAEIYYDNRILERNVYGQGKLLARQYQDAPLHFVYNNPGTNSERWSYPNIGHFWAYEFDALGDDVGTADPYQYGGGYYPDYPSFGDVMDFSFGCTLDGVGASCSEVARLLRIGAAGPAMPRFKIVSTYLQYDEPVRPLPIPHNPDSSQPMAFAAGFAHTYAMYSNLPNLGSVTIYGSFDMQLDTAVGRLALELMLRPMVPQTPGSIWGNDWQKLRYRGVSLSPCAKKILGDLFNGSALNVNDLRLRVGIPQTIIDAADIASSLGAVQPDAVTVGNTIFVDAGALDRFDARTVSGLALLAHEGWHALQSANNPGGKGWQVIDYFRNSVQQWQKGKRPYEDNVFEQDANEVQSIMSNYIAETYGERPCERLGLSPIAK